jgi:hypothetical protein
MLVQCCGFVFGFRDLLGLGGLMPSGALFPSKSGLIKKYTVKHTVKLVGLAGLMPWFGCPLPV